MLGEAEQSLFRSKFDDFPLSLSAAAGVIIQEAKPLHIRRKTIAKLKVLLASAKKSSMHGMQELLKWLLSGKALIKDDFLEDLFVLDAIQFLTDKPLDGRCKSSLVRECLESSVSHITYVKFHSSVASQYVYPPIGTDLMDLCMLSIKRPVFPSVIYAVKFLRQLADSQHIAEHIFELAFQPGAVGSAAEDWIRCTDLRREFRDFVTQKGLLSGRPVLANDDPAYLMGYIEKRL